MEVQAVGRILVPLDGSFRAERAVPYAVNIADRTGAELLLVAVLPSDTDTPGLEIMDSLARSEDAAGSISRIRRIVLSGDPMDEIVRLADAGAADLIVMTIRGLTGRSRRKFGSVAGRVLMTSSVPVLAVRARNWKRNVTVKRQVDHMIVPVDGSNRTAAVEELTVSLALSMNARVTIYHVRTDMEPDSGTIAELCHALERQNCQVEFVVEDGDPAEMIMNFAQVDVRSLVIMCRRGPGAVKEPPLGSVSDFVIRHSRTPVIVVPPVIEERELQEEPEFLP